MWRKFRLGPDCPLLAYLAACIGPLASSFSLAAGRLLIEAAEVWKRRSDKALALKSDGYNPREYLLSALGQASSLCPRIEASLKTAAPAGYELDAAGANDFLTEKAWGLEQAGFGVLLPAWWTGKERIQGRDQSPLTPPTVAGFLFSGECSGH